VCVLLELSDSWFAEIVTTCEVCVHARCRNWVVCSELAFAVELCVLQRNCDSLPKLCRPQWIGIHCRIACSAVNCDSMPKLSCLQRINIRCRNWVVCSEIVIRCRSCVVCSELTFAAKSCVLQRNYDSLSKLCRP